MDLIEEGFDQWESNYTRMLNTLGSAAGLRTRKGAT